MIKNNINFDNQSLHYGLQNTQFLSRSKENVNKPSILTIHLDKLPITHLAIIIAVKSYKCIAFFSDYYS